MELSSERDDFGAAGVSGVSDVSPMRPTHAGLRVRGAEAQPTARFVAVEMTVLVIVSALAMTSIIVSSNELADPRPAVAATRQADRPVARDIHASQAAADAQRTADGRRPSDGVASR